MKFVNYLKGIAGIETYPLISLVLFFSFFLAVGWYAYKTPKKKMQQHADLPLQ
jgi:cytochrome c oxidase cbb3-type subunit IV